MKMAPKNVNETSAAGFFVFFFRLFFFFKTECESEGVLLFFYVQCVLLKMFSFPNMPSGTLSHCSDLAALCIIHVLNTMPEQGK